MDPRGQRPHIKVMLKFTPIILAILYAVAMYRLSAWRMARELDAKSTELADPVLKKADGSHGGSVGSAADQGEYL